MFIAKDAISAKDITFAKGNWCAFDSNSSGPLTTGGGEESGI